MSNGGFVPEGQYRPPGGDLSSLIQRTRDQVATYLGNARTRQRRLLNVAIVAGALATALAGAPAVIPGVPTPVWRTLCVLAAALLPRCSRRDSIAEIKQRWRKHFPGGDHTRTARGPQYRLDQREPEPRAGCD